MRNKLKMYELMSLVINVRNANSNAAIACTHTRRAMRLIYVHKITRKAHSTDKMIDGMSSLLLF